MSFVTGGRASKARTAMVVALVAVMMVATGVPFASAGWEATPYVPVSLDEDGMFQDDRSSRPRINDDGRYVVFESRAALTADDVDDPSDDGELDVYHYDALTRTLTLLTAARPGGTEDQRGSRDPDISDDGRWVVFVSGHDLVASDTNGDPDVYLYDTLNKTYKVLDIHGDSSPSVDDDWGGPRLSGDGKYVAFYTSDELFDEEYDGDSKRDVYRYDIASDETTLVSWPRVGESEDDRGSKAPTISDDGRYVAFFSGRDLDPSDTNGDQDLYIWDAQTGVRTRADVAGDGSSAVGSSVGTFAMSGNGRYVAFTDWDEDVLPGDSNGKADVVMYDRVSDEATLVSQPRVGADQPNRGSRSPSMSDDGSMMVFMSGQDFVPEDTNGSPDFHQWEMATGEVPLLGVPQRYDP